MSPKHEALRLSLLPEALSVIHLVNISGDPFSLSLELTMWEMLSKEKTIQVYLKGDIIDRQALELEGIWRILSDITNTASVLGMRLSAKVSPSRWVGVRIGSRM